MIYPEYDSRKDIIDDDKNFKPSVKKLLDKLPVLRDNIHKVPSVHICMSQNDIKNALSNEMFMIQTKTKDCSKYFYDYK